MAPSVTAWVTMAGRGKRSVSSGSPTRNQPDPGDRKRLQSVKNLHVISPRAVDGPLSPREVQVVAWLAQGKQVQDAAKILGISTNTAWAHLYKAVRKLGVSNRAELTIEAIRLGYVPCPCPEHGKAEVAS
jgi:DNA-binding CsgD family transcriptional regulator